jgi:hypothetical protein
VPANWTEQNPNFEGVKARIWQAATCVTLKPTTL